MHTSLVICTRNRGALIIQTLESVFHGSCLPEEIVVVDQSDDTKTRDAVLILCQTCPQLRYVETQTRGLSRARNIGLRETTGDVIVWTDDDVLVHRDWMKTVISEFQTYPDLLLLYGTVLPPEFFDWRTEFIPHVMLLTARPVSLFHRSATSGIGANMAMRRQLIEIIGPFNDLLGAGSVIPCAEDIDITMRALVHTPRICIHLLNEAQVVHYAGARRGEEYRRFQRATGRGIGRFWGYSLRSQILHKRTGVLYFLKFIQEQRRYWEDFASQILIGKRPTGLITYLCFLAAFWQGLLFPLPETEVVNGHTEQWGPSFETSPKQAMKSGSNEAG